VVLTPHIAAQPRFNALDDLADMMERLAQELASNEIEPNELAPKGPVP
jgi:hypothetical protein